MSYSKIDHEVSPPRVEVPRDYNMAADLVERHISDRIAVIDDEGQYTYRELDVRVRKAAGALAALGVQREQRVGVCMLDSVEWIATFLGAIALGAVPVALNTMLTADDYRYLLKDSRARLVIVSDSLANKIEGLLASKWREFVDAAAPVEHYADTCADDVAFWLYSSGSTGKPKGAMHIHSSAIQTAALYAQPILGITQNDVVYSAAKLFFAYGLGNSLTFPLSVGATVVLCAERPTPAVVLRTFEKHKPTIFCGVPTLFASLLADGGLARREHLRVSTSAGEALPRHVGERWRERVGSDILDGIGSTEMLHIFLSNRPGDIAYGTTGRPVPGYDLDLRGDDGNPAPDGEEGSLWVRGPTACIGYWADRARSLATFHGPWTRTGDRYIRDTQGRWTYSGRADDMLKVGGIWVSPFEVESALSSHPAVLECAVVGHEDADGLTKPKAFVVRSATVEADELKAHVKSKLAPFKYPRWIEFVTELPKTATGKIQRYKLR